MFVFVLVLLIQMNDKNIINIASTEYRRHNNFSVGNNYSIVTIKDRTVRVAGKPDQFSRTKSEFSKLDTQFLACCEIIKQENISIKILPYHVARGNDYYYQAGTGKNGKMVITKMIMPPPDIAECLQYIEPESVRDACVSIFSKKNSVSRDDDLQYSFSNLNIDAISRIPDLKYSTISESDNEIELSVNFNRKYSHWKDILNTTGKIILDKNNHYLMIKYELESKADNFSIIDTYMITNVVDKRSSRQTQSKSKESIRFFGVEKMVTECSVNVVESHGECTDDKFKMSLIGHPEPTGMPNRFTFNIPWHFVISLSGILCLIVATFILHRRNKKAA